MAENTKIEWAHHTFNPWVGCTKVSPACNHCYAEAWAKRTGNGHLWNDGERRRTSEANWRLPLKWNREAEERGIRYRVFCASLADVFDNVVPDEWRGDLLRLIRQTPHLDWLLLTKRIGNARHMLEHALSAGHLWPWPNVWLGITVVNQEELERDLPKLVRIPAALHFLSCEPLLGPLKFEVADGPWNWNVLTGLRENPFGPVVLRDLCPGIDWVIVGGESGSAARPMHPDWVRSARDQCAAAGVPFLFKQWGEWVPGENVPDDRAYKAVAYADGAWSRVSDDWISEADDGPLMYRVGKKRAGRELDGRVHDEFPQSQPEKEI